MKNTEKGFTLIELLIVIAIIGIITGIMFMAIKPKVQTDKAKDTKVRSSLDSVRVKVTAIFAKKDPMGYADAESDSMVLAILDTVDGEIKSNDEKWAAKAQLTNGKWYCKDSSGNASEKVNQDIDDYMCD